MVVRRPCLAALLLVGPMSALVVRAQDAAPILAAARAHYHAHRPAEAVPAYELYLGKKPEDVEATVELGYCLLLLDRKADAWRVLGRAVASGAAGVEAESTWLGLATLPEQASTAIPIAVRLRARYPDNVEFAKAHARLLETAGRYEDAARVWKEVRAGWPDETAALLPLGRLLSWTGDFAAAEDALRSYRTAHATDPQGAFLLAQVQGWRWEWEDAEATLREGLAFDSHHAGLRSLEAEAREYFAPRFTVRPFFWTDSTGFTQAGASAATRAVIDHHLVVTAGVEQTRFTQDSPGYPTIDRFSTRFGLGWMGADGLSLDASYAHHDAGLVGTSDGYKLQARSTLAGTVTGLVVAGREPVTEKMAAVLDKIDVDYLGLAAFDQEAASPWSVSLSGSRFRDGARRARLASRLSFPLVGCVRGEWDNDTFAQSQQSFLYFGPRWYSEQELLLAIRPPTGDRSFELEAKAGIGWSFSEDSYGFPASGAPGFVGEFSATYAEPGRFRCGVRLHGDFLDTDSPHSGYGAEAVLEIFF